jgi:hypothetical protein
MIHLEACQLTLVASFIILGREKIYEACQLILVANFIILRREKISKACRLIFVASFIILGKRENLIILSELFVSF